jgi:hypothetical protein
MIPSPKFVIVRKVTEVGTCRNDSSILPDHALPHGCRIDFTLFRRHAERNAA